MRSNWAAEGVRNVGESPSSCLSLCTRLLESLSSCSVCSPLLEVLFDYLSPTLAGSSELSIL